MVSIRRANSSKNNFKKDLKMENKFELKPFDKVLVRNNDNDVWHIDIFEKWNEPYYVCLMSTWKQCIPYEGNEHLMNTANMPEITDLKNNILFGVELKVGYVLVFKDSHIAGVIIPTEKKELAVSYFNSGWDYLKNIDINSIIAIKGPLKNANFKGGMLLWQKHNK